MAWYYCISWRLIGPSIEQVRMEIFQQAAPEQVDKVRVKSLYKSYVLHLFRDICNKLLTNLKFMQRLEQIRAIVDSFINQGPRETSVQDCSILY